MYPSQYRLAEAVLALDQGWVGGKDTKIIKMCHSNMAGCGKVVDTKTW